jgi:hypothetical protein
MVTTLLRVVVEKRWLYFQACFKTVILAKARTHHTHQKPWSAKTNDATEAITVLPNLRKRNRS